MTIARVGRFVLEVASTAVTDLGVLPDSIPVTARRDLANTNRRRLDANQAAVVLLCVACVMTFEEIALTL